jgi:hypothetical protein
MFFIIQSEKAILVSIKFVASSEALLCATADANRLLKPHLSHGLFFLCAASGQKARLLSVCSADFTWLMRMDPSAAATDIALHAI